MLVFAQMRDHFAEAFFPRLSEWTAAIVIFSLGWVLTLNPELMTSGATTRGYVLMLAVAEQHTWAVLLKVFGALRLAVLLVNGAWRRSPWARAGTAMLPCFFWMQIALSFATVFGFAVTMAAGFLGMDLVNIFRAMRDARIVDEAYARDRPVRT